MTKEQFEGLSRYEDNLRRAVKNNYFRHMRKEDLRKVYTVYEQITGTEKKPDFGCGKCSLKIMQKVGAFYFEYKREIAIGGIAADPFGKISGQRKNGLVNEFGDGYSVMARKEMVSESPENTVETEVDGSGSEPKSRAKAVGETGSERKRSKGKKPHASGQNGAEAEMKVSQGTEGEIEPGAEKQPENESEKEAGVDNNPDKEPVNEDVAGLEIKKEVGKCS